MVIISIVGIAYIDMYVYICVLLRAVVQSIGHCLLNGPMDQNGVQFHSDN